MAALIVGVADVGMGKLGQSPLDLTSKALNLACMDAGINCKDLDVFLCCPTVDHSVMFAHQVAGSSSCRPNIVCKTIDCGGASSCVAVMEAAGLISRGDANVVAVAAGDALLSMSNEKFASLVSLGSTGKQSVRIDALRCLF